MKEIQPTMKVAQVAERLCINRQTLLKYVKEKKWNDVPKPKPQKVCGSYRWEAFAVEAFLNGDKTDYEVADPKKMPDDWSKYAI